MALDALFSRYNLKNLDLANRLTMAPMTRKRSPGGIPNQVVAEYYRRRAGGGIGLIITEGTLVEHPLAAQDENIPHLTEDAVEGWGLVLDEIGKTATPAFVQLWHQGPVARPGIGAGAFEDRQFHSPAELEAVLLPLRDAGIDIFHASTRRFWRPEFADSDLTLAGWTKKITGCPTIMVGNIGLVTAEFFGTGPESTDEIMRRFDRGEFDLLAVGRPLLSDAEWPNKVRAGLSEEIVDYSQEANAIYP